MDNAAIRPTLMNRVLACGLFCVSGALLTWQAFVQAPASDEIAHLISGVATVRTGDPAYYRVNPPLHRLVSGFAVEATLAPDLPWLYPASAMPSGVRNEFRFSEDVIATYPNDYRRFFYIGRLVRLPFILLAGWWLLRGLTPPLQTAGLVAAILWLTSPMVLGHGWTVMPDAFSGCAMVFLLMCTLDWLAYRTWGRSIIVGIAWGAAIGTKFTFAPVFLVWPIGLVLHQTAMGQFRFQEIFKLCAAHTGQGFVALLVVIGLYGGADLGVRLQDHGFRSERLGHWTNPDDSLIGRVLGPLPSPLPKQFLVGVDEQQGDLERGHPTYFSGTWYPDGMWWYYLAGLVAKEQVLFTLGLPLIAVGGFLLMRARRCSVDTVRDVSRARKQLAAWCLCLFAATAVLGLLSLHSKMALNVRYAFPALPPLMLLMGIGFEQLVMRIPFLGENRNGISVGKLMLVGLLCLPGIELVRNCPHFFAYANPWFGGSYRVPPVLHDSNFDGAQDLWLLERWLSEHPVLPGHLRYTCIHGDVPRKALTFTPTPPSVSELQRLLAERRGTVIVMAAYQTASPLEVLVMRGLGQPAPWMQLQGTPEPQVSQLLRELLLFPPDEFLSPSLAIYRSKAGIPGSFRFLGHGLPAHP